MDVKQEDNLNQMIWKVPEMISYLSEYFTVATGDEICLEHRPELVRL